MNMLETSDVSTKMSDLSGHFVYVLSSLVDHGLYIGYTTHIETRLKQHLRGSVISTRRRRPLTLIYCEMFINEVDAKAREEFLKSGYGRQQLKNILKRTLSVASTQTPPSLHHLKS